MASRGKLLVVATPIGNLGDLSARAASALSESDFWIVEDTRQSAKLQSHLGIRKPMRILNEHSTFAQIAQLEQEIAEDKTAVLITDGGSPAISDPGAILVDRCHDCGIEVDAIPGPSAVTNALMLSGFFAQRFAFLGFLPRKPTDMKKELAPFADSPLTLVLFESPFRAEKTLEIAAEVLGKRRYAVCREMTKAHQQVFRGRLPDTPGEAEVPRKGEWTIVVEGRRKSG